MRERNTNRVSGIACCGVFIILLINGYRYDWSTAVKTTSAVCFVIAALVTLAAPMALTPVRSALNFIYLVATRLISYPILAIFFYFCFCPIGLIWRLFGRKADNKYQLSKNRETYWINKIPITVESIEKQF